MAKKKKKGGTNVKDLFSGRGASPMGTIPGAMPGGQPGQMQIKIDINNLPDMPCVMCGEKEFQSITRFKFLSRTVSPNGQEGNVNVNMHKCTGCGWLFNPKEWMDKMGDTLNMKPAKEADDPNAGKPETEAVTPKEEEEDDNRELCRKCGAFYNKGEDHNCVEP